MFSFNQVSDEFANSELELLFDSDSDSENRSLFGLEAHEDVTSNISNNNRDCDDNATNVTNSLKISNLQHPTLPYTTHFVSADQSGSYSFDSLVPFSNPLTLCLPSNKISNNTTTPLEILTKGNSYKKYNPSNCFTSDTFFGYDNEIFYKTSTPEPHLTLQPEVSGLSSSSSSSLSDDTLNNSSNKSFEKVSLEQVTDLLVTDQQQSDNKEEMTLTLNDFLNITNSELVESICSSNDCFTSSNSNTITNTSKKSFKGATKKRSISKQKDYRVFKKPKTFQCSDCLKMYQSPAHVKRHKISVHSNERNYPCILCDKQFKRPDHLQSHERKIHKVN